MATRNTLACTQFAPYAGQGEHAWRFDVLEVNFLLAGLVQLALAVRTNRLPSFLGVLLVGVVMESVGFVTKSHTHVEFRLQLACFLSAKEVVWYANTVFAALVAAGEFTLMDKGRDFALLVGLIAILQDAPYELTNALPGVQAVYINTQDFMFGDLGEALFDSGSSMVVVSFFCVSVAVGWIHQRRGGSDWWALPALSLPVLVACLTPFNLVKYLGCAHVPWTLDFHQACVARQTLVRTNPLLVLGFALVVLRLLSTVKRKPHAGSPATLHLLLVSAALCHSVFAYHAWLAQRSAADTTSTLIVVGSFALAHMGLLCFLANKDKPKSN